MPLEQHFSALVRQQHRHPRLGPCARLARVLLDTARDAVALHGDLHHGNVLDAGPRSWLAIDPKALLGERAFDVANLLANPSPYAEIVHSRERMLRHARLYATALQLDLGRVLAFGLAHAGLSASWDLEDGLDPAFRLGCIEVLAPLVAG